MKSAQNKSWMSTAHLHYNYPTTSPRKPGDITTSALLIMLNLRVIIYFSILPLLSSCNTPRFDMKPIQNTKNARFAIESNNVNGILGIRYWTKKRGDWLLDTNMHYYKGSEIAYGQINPPWLKPDNKAVHLAAEAPPLPKNRTIYMDVEYQYDKFMTPSARTKTYSFIIDKSGAVTHFKEEPPVRIVIPEQ